jgi:hypothetical protein
MDAAVARGVYVYTVAGAQTGQQPLRVAVEVVDGGDNVPRTATSF